MSLQASSGSRLELLERQIADIPDERGRGDAFEHAVLHWLTSEPDLGLRSAWRWPEWPERVSRGLPASDDGIDLVAEDRDGGLVAVQAKFRLDPGRAVGRDEAQKALSYPEIFQRYLVVSNAWDRSRSASRGLAGEDRLAWALREELVQSDFDWLAGLGDASPAATSRFDLRPHQERAVETVVAKLRDPGRTQLRMACGTGKTVTALWIAEALQADRTLVLAPTLLLLKQLRAEWLRQADRPFAAVAVCSAQDVGEGADAWLLDPSDIAGEVTTDPARIAGFLRRQGRRVVFSTYQSSPRIADAQAMPRVPAFDLAVADEAHKVAGVSRARDRRTSAERTVLDGTKIRSTRRLFLTATPRVYAARYRASLESRFDVEVASMDDEDAFGPVAHEFGFRAAVDAGVLADYRLVITIADDEAAARTVRERRFVEVGGDPVDAEQVATAVAVRRAAEELALRRVISFHATIERSRAFARLLALLPTGPQDLSARWVSGQQTVRDRMIVLSELREPQSPVVVSNARCLSEGIDVPALDAVVFADPRRSAIDLVHAIGRVMRSAPGNRVGWVIVPLHLTPNQLANPEAAMRSSAFEPVVAVLRALRSHDPLLASDAGRIRFLLGARINAEPPAWNLPIDVIGADGLPLEQLIAAIRLRSVEVTADSWSQGVAALRAFAAREGHARVPKDHQEGSFSLGSWVSIVRGDYRRALLGPERIAELTALPGWTWDPRADDWAAGLAALQSFARRERHARVAVSWKEGDYRLGGWVNLQRYGHNTGRLDPERTSQLEAIPGWTWDPIADDWETAVRLVRSFAVQEGHARVPVGHVEEGLRLGIWVHGRRVDRKRGRLDPREIAELEAIPGWTWDPLADDWNVGISRLEKFVAREGHARVPTTCIEDGFRLGAWVHEARTVYKEHRLSRARINQLEAFPGWLWSVMPSRSQAAWSNGFERLVTFVKREGHARAPFGHLEDGYRLGIWVSEMRKRYLAGKLGVDETRALTGLPGWSWGPYADAWADRASRLRAFADREGHVRVPGSYVEDGVKLGDWVTIQRSKWRHGRLSAARAAELEAIPGWKSEPETTISE